MNNEDLHNYFEFNEKDFGGSSQTVFPILKFDLPFNRRFPKLSSIPGRNYPSVTLTNYAIIFLIVNQRVITITVDEIIGWMKVVLRFAHKN